MKIFSTKHVSSVEYTKIIRHINLTIYNQNKYKMNQPFANISLNQEEFKIIQDNINLLGKDENTVDWPMTLCGLIVSKMDNK